MGLIASDKNSKYVARELLRGWNKLGVKYLQLIFLIVTGYFVRFVKNETFRFDGKDYRYFYHAYNHTWVNERAAEVPIVLEAVKNESGEVLEIGNVLKHYYSLPHDVLDKYEVGKGIINQDVVDCKLKKKYDLIISISTMEHVGWDETIKDENKIPRALDHLRKYLKPGGRMIVTVPIRYNPFLDKHLENGKFFSRAVFLRRGMFNTWRELPWSQARNLNYAREISARGLAILYINN